MQTRLKFDRGFYFVQVPEPKFDISAENVEELIDNEMQRDGNEWHITIITAKEFSKTIVPEIMKRHNIIKKEAERVARGIVLERFNNEIKSNPKNLGLGRVILGENVAYFIVIEWKEVQEFRKSLELDEKDFHITVAFGSEGDIHNVPKDKTTLVKSSENESIKRFVKHVVEEDKDKKMKDLTLGAAWDQLYKN